MYLRYCRLDILSSVCTALARSTMPVFSPSSCSKTSLSTVVGFARTIIGSSSRSEIRSLLVQLTDTLKRTSQVHDEDRSYSARSSCSSNNGFQKTTEQFPWVSTQYKRILRSAAIESQQTGNCNGNDNSNGNESTRSSTDNPPLSSTNATYGETPPRHHIQNPKPIIQAQRQRPLPRPIHRRGLRKSRGSHLCRPRRNIPPLPRNRVRSLPFASRLLPSTPLQLTLSLPPFLRPTRPWRSL